VIYLDSSVALAQLLNEPRVVSSSVWNAELVSSRLLEFEVWTRLNKGHLERSHEAVAQELLDGILLLDMSTPVLARALRPFPLPIRTLDALHLASMEFLRSQGEALELASFDRRLVAAAQALGFPVYAL
jgi:predicted nucleic acid-binding protein